MSLIHVKNIKPVHKDDRGEIVDIFEGEVHHSGIITFTKGAVRANHYHRLQRQYTYVIAGSIELKMKDALDPNAKTETVIMKAGDFVDVPPNVIHAYKGLSDASMICLTTRERTSETYEDDTVRVDPI